MNKITLTELFHILAWSYEDRHYQWTKGLYNGQFELPPWAHLKQAYHEEDGGRDFFVIGGKDFDLWVFPGTLPNWRDWWVNLQARLVPLPVRGEVSEAINFAGGECHQGAAGIIPILDKHMKVVQGKPVMLLGHSQGFMSAVPAAVWAKDKGFEVLGVLGTGCPRVGNKAFVKGAVDAFPVLAFFHALDVVRFLPSHVMGYQGFDGLLFSENGIKRGQLPGITLDPYCPDGRFGQWLRELYRKLKYGLKGGPINDHDSTKYIEALEALLKIHAVQGERRIINDLDKKPGGARLAQVLSLKLREHPYKTACEVLA